MSTSDQPNKSPTDAVSNFPDLGKENPSLGAAGTASASREKLEKLPERFSCERKWPVLTDEKISTILPNEDIEHGRWASAAMVCLNLRGAICHGRIPTRFFDKNLMYGYGGRRFGEDGRVKNIFDYLGGTKTITGNTELEKWVNIKKELMTNGPIVMWKQGYCSPVVLDGWGLDANGREGWIIRSRTTGWRTVSRADNSESTNWWQLCTGTRERQKKGVEFKVFFADDIQDGLFLAPMASAESLGPWQRGFNWRPIPSESTEYFALEKTERIGMGSESIGELLKHFDIEKITTYDNGKGLLKKNFYTSDDPTQMDYFNLAQLVGKEVVQHRTISKCPSFLYKITAVRFNIESGKFNVELEKLPPSRQ